MITLKPLRNFGLIRIFRENVGIKVLSLILAIVFFALVRTERHSIKSKAFSRRPTEQNVVSRPQTTHFDHERGQSPHPRMLYRCSRPLLPSKAIHVNN